MWIYLHTYQFNVQDQVLVVTYYHDSSFVSDEVGWSQPDQSEDDINSQNGQEEQFQ